jgi:hypothetical protein
LNSSHYIHFSSAWKACLASAHNGPSVAVQIYIVIHSLVATQSVKRRECRHVHDSSSPSPHSWLKELEAVYLHLLEVAEKLEPPMSHGNAFIDVQIP